MEDDEKLIGVKETDTLRGYTLEQIKELEEKYENFPKNHFMLILEKIDMVDRLLQEKKQDINSIKNNIIKTLQDTEKILGAASRKN